VLGAGLAVGLAAAPHGTANADTVGHYDAYAAEVGDDNADGRIDEDESGFDCRVMGNLRCGPGALLPDGSLAAPGDYSDPNCWPGAIYCPPAGTPLRRHCDGQERGTRRTAGLRCRRIRRRLQQTDRAGTAPSFRTGGRSAALSRTGGHAYPPIGGHAFS
jgi:hypothetical protein